MLLTFEMTKSRILEVKHVEAIVEELIYEQPPKSEAELLMETWSEKNLTANTTEHSEE